MTAEIATVLVILLVTIVLFITERLRPDLVAILVLLSVILTGLVSPKDAFSCLGNPAVITVAAIFIISAGLFRTGVAHAIGNQIELVAGKNPLLLIIIIMLTASLMSSFMNNVGAAAVLLPVVVGICRKTNIPPSKLLIPLSFGSLLGGTLTLIGTPSNLLVNAALFERGLEPIKMFDFLPIGVVLMVLGIIYMVVIGRKLLPSPSPAATPFSVHQHDDLTEMYHLDDRLFRIRIPPGSRLIGRTLAKSTLRDAWDLNVLGIEREGVERLDPAPETVLLEGDVLLLEGDLNVFRKRDVEPYLQILPPREWSDEDLQSIGIGICEVVVAPRSSFAGKTLQELHFREKYGLSVVGLWRGNTPIVIGIGDKPLQVGDALLLQGKRTSFRILEMEPDLLFLEGPEAGRARLRPDKAPVALGALGVMLVMVIMGWLDLATAAMLAATITVLFGILDMGEAQHIIEWKAVFIIGSMLPLGLAMERSGTAQYLANLCIQFFGRFGPAGVLTGIALFAGLSVQILSNSATAVLVTPIALNAAQHLQANPQTFAMAVALSASAAFLTPIAHQSHLLVMGAGGYSFSDYAKVGIGLWVLLLVAIVVLLPLLIPLYPA